MRRRKVSARPVGRGGRICWRDLHLIKGDEEKCSEKRLEKRSYVRQAWDEAYEGTWAHVWLAFVQDRAGTFLRLNTSGNQMLRQSIGVQIMLNTVSFEPERPGWLLVIPSTSSMDIVGMVEKMKTLQVSAPGSCEVLRLSRVRLAQVQPMSSRL